MTRRRKASICQCGIMRFRPRRPLRLCFSLVSAQTLSAIQSKPGHGHELIGLTVMQSFAINFQPFYPVVSVAEMCTIEPTLALVYTNVPHSSEERNPFPPVLTKLAICSIAALHREVPRHITRSLLRTLQGQVEGPAGMAMMRRSNIANVQTALLLGVSAELHASSTFEGGSRSWLTVGSAIRMALDIVCPQRYHESRAHFTGPPPRSAFVQGPAGAAASPPQTLGGTHHCGPLVRYVLRPANDDQSVRLRCIRPERLRRWI